MTNSLPTLGLSYAVGTQLHPVHPVEAQIKTQNRRMVLKHEGALLVATESNLAKMMMMFITISARDQSSKGRRRILAFQQRRHEAVVGRLPTSDPGHGRARA